MFLFHGGTYTRSGVQRYDVKVICAHSKPPPPPSQSATLPTLEKTRQLHNLLRKESNSKQISPDCHEKY